MVVMAIVKEGMLPYLKGENDALRAHVLHFLLEKKREGGRSGAADGKW
jgi:hypothetical protein